MRRSIVVAGLLCVALVRDGWGICREVGEPDEPPPLIEPDQSVLVVKLDDAVLGEHCGPTGPDAGAPDPDAGVACEEVRGPAIRMVVQPKFRTGPGGARFALLMVTPTDPVIALEEPGLLEQLAQQTERQVVINDVCVETSALGYQCKDPQWPSVVGSCGPQRTHCGGSGGGGSGGGSSGGSTGGGCGGSYGSYGDDDDDDGIWYLDAAPSSPDGAPWWDYADAGQPDAAPPPIQTIGAYEVVEARPESIAQLAAWLTALGYGYEQYDLDALAPYVDTGWTVLAVRVSLDTSFEGALEPLSFTYAGSELRLPLGVSQIPAPEPLLARLAIFIAAEGRYDVPGANVVYANPTPLGGGMFLTRNDLTADLTLGADSDPVATRVEGDPTYWETVEVNREIRIPSSECPYPDSDGGGGNCPGSNNPPPPPPPPDDDDSDDGWCACRAGDFPSPGGVLLVVVCAVALRPRRRYARKRASKRWKWWTPRSRLGE